MEKWLDSDTLHINTKTKKTPSTQEKKSQQSTKFIKLNLSTITWVPLFVSVFVLMVSRKSYPWKALKLWMKKTENNQNVLLLYFMNTV